MGFWSWLKRKMEEDEIRSAERRAREKELKEIQKTAYVQGKAFEKGRLTGREEFQRRKEWDRTVGNLEWRAKNIWGISTKARKKKNAFDI
jgi:hypothetical protein